MDKECRQKLREGTLALSDYMTFQTDGDMAVSLTRNADIAGKVVLSVHASSECSEPSSLMSANPGISKSFSLTTDDAQELSRFLQMAGISQDTQSKAMDFVTKSGSIPEPMATAEPVDTEYVSIAVMEGGDEDGKYGLPKGHQSFHNRVMSSHSKDDDNDSEEWYDKNGRPTPNGAYDAGGHYHRDRDTVDEEFKYEKGWSTRPTADGKHEVYHHEKGTVHPDQYNKQGDAQATADRLANDGLEENAPALGMLDNVVDEMIGGEQPKKGNIEAAVMSYNERNLGRGEIDDALLHNVSDEYSLHPMILKAAVRGTDQAEPEQVAESLYDKDSEEEAIEIFKRTGEWPNWFPGYARRMAEIRMERDKDKPEVVPVKVEEDVADLHLTPEEMEQARAFASGDSYDISEMLYDKLVGYYGTIPSEDPLEWIKNQLTHDLAVGEQEEYPLQPESPEFGGRTQNPGANTHMGDNPMEEEMVEEDTDNDYGHHRGPRKVGQITGFDMKGRRDIQSPGANTKQSDNPMSASAVMETAASKMKKLMEAVNWNK